MITIQAEFTQKQCDLGLIGRVGENASRQIVFDCAEALRAFPGADILCIYQRPGEGAPYLAPLSGEKGVYTLVLADTDVALPGFARMELRAEKGGKIVKSAYFTGEIAPALRAPGERPDAAAADTMDRIAALLAQAQRVLRSGSQDKRKGFVLYGVFWALCGALLTLIAWVLTSLFL